MRSLSMLCLVACSGSGSFSVGGDENNGNADGDTGTVASDTAVEDTAIEDTAPPVDPGEQADWGVYFTNVRFDGASTDVIRSEGIQVRLDFEVTAWAPASKANDTVTLGVLWESGDGASCAQLTELGAYPGLTLTFGAMFPGPQDEGSQRLVGALFPGADCTDLSTALSPVSELMTVDAVRATALAPVSFAPMPDAIEVSRSTSIRLDVQEDLLSLPAPTVSVSADGSAVTASVAVDGASIRVTPATALPANARITVTVQPGLEGVSGRSLVDEVAWGFRTGS